MPSSSLFPFKVSALQIIIQYMPYFNWENPQKSHIANPLLNNHTNFQCSIKTTAGNLSIFLGWEIKCSILLQKKQEKN